MLKGTDNGTVVGREADIHTIAERKTAFENQGNIFDFIERENINILEFGEATAYDQKIRTIKDRLMEYAREAVKESTSTTNN